MKNIFTLLKASVLLTAFVSCSKNSPDPAPIGETLVPKDTLASYMNDAVVDACNSVHAADFLQLDSLLKEMAGVDFARMKMNATTSYIYSQMMAGITKTTVSAAGDTSTVILLDPSAAPLKIEIIRPADSLAISPASNLSIDYTPLDGIQVGQVRVRDIPVKFSLVTGGTELDTLTVKRTQLNPKHSLEMKLRMWSECALKISFLNFPMGGLNYKLTGSGVKPGLLGFNFETDDLQGELHASLAGYYIDVDEFSYTPDKTQAKKALAVLDAVLTSPSGAKPLAADISMGLTVNKSHIDTTGASLLERMPVIPWSLVGAIDVMGEAQLVFTDPLCVEIHLATTTLVQALCHYIELFIDNGNPDICFKYDNSKMGVKNFFSLYYFNRAAGAVIAKYMEFKDLFNF